MPQTRFNWSRIHGTLACFQLLCLQNPFPGVLLLQAVGSWCASPLDRTDPSLAKTFDADVLHLERVGSNAHYDERTSQRLVSLWNCSCRSNPFQLHHHWYLMRPRYPIIIKPVNDGDPLFSMVTSPKFRLLIKHCILFRQWHATCYLPRVDLFSDSCCCHLLSPKHRQWNSDGGMRILTCSEDQYYWTKGKLGNFISVCKDCHKTYK